MKHLVGKSHCKIGQQAGIEHWGSTIPPLLEGFQFDAASALIKAHERVFNVQLDQRCAPTCSVGHRSVNASVLANLRRPAPSRPMSPFRFALRLPVHESQPPISEIRSTAQHVDTEPLPTAKCSFSGRRHGGLGPDDRGTGEASDRRAHKNPSSLTMVCATSPRIPCTLRPVSEQRKSAGRNAGCSSHVDWLTEIRDRVP